MSSASSLPAAGPGGFGPGPTTASLLLTQRRWRPWVPASAAVTAIALAVAMLLGTPAVFVVVGVAMLLVAGGWVLLLGLPSPRGTTAVLAGAALILLAGGVLSMEARESLLPGAVALAMIVEFVHQLARRDGRPRLVESICASVTGITLLTCGACVLLLTKVEVGVAYSVAVFAALAASCLADLGLLGGSGGRRAALAAAILGALTAGATGALLGVTGPAWLPAAAGGLAGGVGYALRQTQSVLPRIVRHRAQVASGVASVLAGGVIAYAATWLALGPMMTVLGH